MDSFFGIGVFELVFIIIFALIFLGPERLPQVLRDLIGFMRKVRSLSSEITQQINDEFGDLAELDPRRQIQQTLDEGLGAQKKQTKPLTSSSAAAAKPKTNTATQQKTSATKAIPNQKKSTAASTTKPVKAAKVEKTKTAETKAEETKTEEIKTEEKAESTTDGGKLTAKADLPATAEDSAAAPVAAAPEATEAGAQDDVGGPDQTDLAPTSTDETPVAVEEGPVEAKETADAGPQQAAGKEQISPASVYFAQQKKAAEAENGVDADTKPNHAVASEATRDIAVDAAAENEEPDTHSIAPPELAHQQPQTDEAEVVEQMAQPSGPGAAKEENA